MKPLVDPGSQTIDADSVTFRHLYRVQLPALAVVLVVVPLVVLLRKHGNASSDGIGGPSWLWIVVVALALALTLVQVVGNLRAAWARWGALLLGLLAAAHFGPRADLPKSAGLSIVQVELAGSWSRVRQCHCVSPLRDALWEDLGFIAAYGSMLLLLVCWASCYYRLGVVRDARKLMISATVGAAVLDVLEDLFLRLGTDHHVTDKAWQAAAVCAWAKWLLLIVVVAYVAGGVFAWWVTPKWIRIASWQLYADVRPTVDSGESPARPKRMTREHAPPPLDVTPPAKPGATDRRPSFGIALSGGGIRASSISLGALQVMEKTEDLGWDRAHVVTAVSGGSNMASGWSISRSEYQTSSEGNPARTAPSALAPRPWIDDDGTSTPEERHLVENLGYLLLSEPRGSSADRESLGDVLAAEPPPSYRPAAIATVLSGLAVNTTVLLCSLWVLTRPIGWLLRYLVGSQALAANRTDFDTPKPHHKLLTEHNLHHLVSSGSYALPGVVFVVLGFALLLIWVAVGQFVLADSTNSNTWRAVLIGLKSASYGAMGLGAALLVLLWGFVELVAFVPHIGSGKTLLAALASAGGVAGSTLHILRKPFARLAPKLGGIAFLAVALLLAAVCTWKAAQHGVVWGVPWHAFGWNSGYNWLLALAMLLAVQLLVSPERWALAPFYRGKLRSAYATYRGQGQVATPYVNDNATREAAQKEPSFSAFTPPGGTPLQVTTPFLVCATATVSTPAVRTHFGTPALSVTFDPAHMTLHFPNDEPGEWSQYQVSTATIDRLGRPFGKRMSTMMAVAIASAAVSPAMGRYRIGPTSMLLTFFNVRLGVWIANPRYVAQLEAAGLAGAPKLGYARTGLSYLFREFFGWHNLDDPYLYLTDGGHWENTGLVEMLRNPNISEVVCIDADSGPGDAVSSLTKAIKIAGPECGVHIDISLDPLRTVPSTSFAPAYAPRAVNVGFFTNGPAYYKAGDQVGVLWYSRPTLTTAMPQRLLAFHEGQQDFPRASTLNQFFDVATFQAYRDLGRESTCEIVDARSQLLEVLPSVIAETDYVRALAQLKAMGEYQHWVFAEVARGALAIAGATLVREFCQSVHDSLQ